MDGLPGSQHLFWDPHDIRLVDHRSRRAESRLFSWGTRLRQEIKARPSWDNGQQQPHLKIARSVAARIPRTGLSWWSHNRLKPAFGKKIQKMYGDSVSAIYLAPMSGQDSERMRSLLLYLNKPFVVHLWDIMDTDQIDAPGFQWLLANAVHVFCLSRPMIEYIRPFQTSASILPFTRNPSLHLAKVRERGPLRIALIGVCYRYRDGLSLLEEAISMVQKQGMEIEVVYIGPRKNIEGWSFSGSKNFRVTGFMATDEDRDRALSECHVGFLPGPLAPPAENTYSRFSIPSRILDFMATALPQVATVHAQSATAAYMRDMQMEGAIAVTAAELAQKLDMLARPDLWIAQSEASLSAFHVSQQEQRSLAYWLTRAAVTEDNELRGSKYAEVQTQAVQSNDV
jgi:hypothetical protein